MRHVLWFDGGACTELFGVVELVLTSFRLVMTAAVRTLCAPMYVRTCTPVGRGHEEGASSTGEERRVRGVRGSVGRGPRVRVYRRVIGGGSLQLICASTHPI